MRFNNFLRLITITLLICFTTVGVSAQKRCDELFSQGQVLQSKGKYKQAIKKYNAAKECYDSQSKKSLCDNQIAICRRSSSTPGHKQTPGPAKKQNPELTVSNEHFDLETYNYKTLTVNVTAKDIDSWSVSAVPNSDGSTFLTVSKGSNGSSIVITCPENVFTTDRSQKIEVTGGDLKAYITVTQAGHPVELTADKTALSYSKKGGDKTVAISSNSTTLYPENSDKNWYVAEKPDWVSYVIKPKKKKKGGFLGKITDKYNEVVNGENPDEENDGETEIEIRVDKLTKSDPDYEAGRKAEFVIKSDNKTLIISIVQK